jgi:hypothetical protein
VWGGPRGFRRGRGVGCLIEGSLVERRGGRHATASLRTAGRSLELTRDLFVRSNGRGGEVPGPAVGIVSWIRHLGKGSVDETSVADGRVLVNHGTDEGMTKAHLRPHLEKARSRRRLGRLGRDTEARGGREDQGWVTCRLGGCHQQQAPAVVRKRTQAPPEALFDPGRQGYAIRQAETAGECGRCPASRQLEQCERIAVSLREDPLPNGLVDAARDRRDEDRPSVGLFEGRNAEFRETREVRKASGFAQREDNHDGLRGEPASDEAEDLRRRPVEPLSIIDKADQWLGFGNLREEIEHSKPDKETIRRGPWPQSERRGERLALWIWQMFEVIEERRAELVEPSERQFHLGLHAGRAHDTTSGSLPEDVVEQGCFANTGVASHHHGRADAAARVCQQAI